MSESEEMYLITIARLNESGIESPVPLPQLAMKLNIAPVSVSQMIRKLEEAGLVTYTPYKGAELTASGLQLALRVLRHHRLWEVFLVEYLKISPPEADTLADRMEHIFPEGTSERLSTFLGNPAFSPNGKPIPPSQWREFPLSDLPLDQLKAGESGQVTQITTTPAARAFLAAQGIAVGSQVAIMAIGHNGDTLLQNNQGEFIHLASSLVKSIFVKAKELSPCNSALQSS
jgi:DtxR family Mn-dependent transcriptional regulator